MNFINVTRHVSTDFFPFKEGLEIRFLSLLQPFRTALNGMAKLRSHRNIAYEFVQFSLSLIGMASSSPTTEVTCDAQQGSQLTDEETKNAFTAFGKIVYC